MNLTLRKPPEQAAASPGKKPTTGIAPDAGATGNRATTTLADPGDPIPSITSIDPFAAGAPGGRS